MKSLRNRSSTASPSSHQFVFQSSGDEKEPLTTTEPIYHSTSNLSASCPPLKQQTALHRITEKYDTCRTAEDLPPNHVDQNDVEQVHAFFASYKTQVTVCPALANMYLSEDSSSWELKYTGIPALLVDSGESRSRRAPLVQLVLAERGTGFMLWRDVLDPLSSYQAPDPCFHTMCLSANHRHRVGLSFDDAAAAAGFLSQLQATCSRLASATGTGKKASKKSARRQLPRKQDISKPCCFQHVTGVRGDEVDDLYTVQSLVQQKR